MVLHRSLVRILKIRAGVLNTHHAVLAVDTVYETLEEHLLIQRPSLVLGQTGLLRLFDGVSDIAADRSRLAQHLNLAVIAALQRVHKLNHSLIAAVVAQLVHLHVCAVNQSQRIVH